LRSVPKPTTGCANRDVLPQPVLRDFAACLLCGVLAKRQTTCHATAWRIPVTSDCVVSTSDLPAPRRSHHAPTQRAYEIDSASIHATNSKFTDWRQAAPTTCASRRHAPQALLVRPFDHAPVQPWLGTPAAIRTPEDWNEARCLVCVSPAGEFGAKMASQGLAQSAGASALPCKSQRGCRGSPCVRREDVPHAYAPHRLAWQRRSAGPMAMPCVQGRVGLGILARRRRAVALAMGFSGTAR
jgi:hypothetical protein